MTAPLWQPSPDRIAGTNLTAFMAKVAADGGPDFTDYGGIYGWSVGEIEAFWDKVWDFCGVIGDKQGPVLVDGDKMPGARFFPEAKVNFAENLLRRRDEADALVFWGEDKVKRRLSFAELYDEVARVARGLAAEGVGPGDRVAGFMPNMPEAIIAMLATSALGGIWSSCSPDFGVQGVLDRFGQIEPKVLFCPDGYYYNGKTIETLKRIGTIAAELPSLTRIVVAPYIGGSTDLSAMERAVTWRDFAPDRDAGDIAFARQPFNAPLFIMFSSGTTGKPKCIVHGIGGTLLQHLKEHQLQCDVKRDDRVFYFTTCGWMMWNWLVSGLASEAALLLYDGSPFHPSGNILFDYMQAEKGTLFGTSAKYIDALGKAGLDPVSSHDLSTLRTITSTGSPLAAEGFDYVYRHIKADVCLSSIAGGTDIIGCFMGGNPDRPGLARRDPGPPSGHGGRGLRR